MRYTAQLQRFDDPHVTVAESDERAECVAAATAIYAALVPIIYARGDAETREDIAEARKVFGDDSPEHREAQQARQWGNGLSAYLRAREWGIGIYDTKRPDDATASYAPNLVYWIGATREDPAL